MTPPARIALAPDQPPGAVVADVAPPDRRLVAGLQAGPDTQAAHLGDALLQLADQTAGPLVLDLGQVDWIDSGACAVLIKFWKALKAQSRALALAITPPVREQFRITSLDRLIPCYPNRAAAVEAARTAQKAFEAGPRT